MICQSCGKDAKDEIYCPRCGQRVQPYEHVVARSVVPDKRAPVSGSDPAKPDVCRNCGTFVGKAETCYCCGASLLPESDPDTPSPYNGKKLSKSGWVAIWATALHIGLMITGIALLTSKVPIIAFILLVAGAWAEIPALAASIVTYVNGCRKNFNKWRKTGGICLTVLIVKDILVFIALFGRLIIGL